jgi:hypothetical protein
MAKSKKKKSNGGGFKLNLAVAAGFVPLAVTTLDKFQSGGVGAAAKWAAEGMTGYSTDRRDFVWQRMKYGALPIIGGLIVHKIASMLGINRMLGRAKVPLLRV